MRTANLTLEQKVAPRRLTGEMSENSRRYQSFCDNYCRERGIPFFDTEETDFANDIGNALFKGGWTDARATRNWTENVKGVFIADTDGASLPGEDILANALSSAGVPFTRATIAKEGYDRASPSFEPGKLYLLVGAKP